MKFIPATATDSLINDTRHRPRCHPSPAPLESWTEVQYIDIHTSALRNETLTDYGTLGDAGLGAIIGSVTGNAGAEAGAAVGLLGGALMGDQMQARQQQVDEV